MADENTAMLFAWGNAVVNAASGAGFPMPALGNSGELKDFVGWGRQVNAAAGGMITLPALAEDADYGAALGWAKSLDGQARAMLPGLPELP